MTRGRAWIPAGIGATLAAVAMLLGPATGAPPREGPILPLVARPIPDPRKVALGERLFHDPRLSRSGRTSCASCHDLATNGATARARDVGDDGRRLRFNTPTVFNAGRSFRLNWEGRVRDVATLVAGSLANPSLMGGARDAGAARIARDPVLGRRMRAVYGHSPSPADIRDALTRFVETLDTPDSPFDRWLGGDARAIDDAALRGYAKFRGYGCVACHQGVNIGANLSQRHGIFHPLASPDPAMLRVPSLRNVAATAPYFHDGSAATMEQAIFAMARAQLDRRLTRRDVDDITAFLRSLSGRYRGRPVAPARR